MLKTVMEKKEFVAGTVPFKDGSSVIRGGRASPEATIPPTQVKKKKGRSDAKKMFPKKTKTSCSQPQKKVRKLRTQGVSCMGGLVRGGEVKQDHKNKTVRGGKKKRASPLKKSLGLRGAGGGRRGKYYLGRHKVVEAIAGVCSTGRGSGQ